MKQAASRQTTKSTATPGSGSANAAGASAAAESVAAESSQENVAGPDGPASSFESAGSSPYSSSPPYGSSSPYGDAESPAAYTAAGAPVAAPLSNQERESMILEHLPQVRLIARRIHERLPESVSLDDLISTGVLGLISAIDRFDAAHNVKLKTYAEYKIRGAILDSLRGLDWAPRQQRKRAKRIEAAIQSAERKLHHTPSEEEIAQELGLKIEEYHEWLVEIRGLNLGSLENASADEDNRDLLRYISDDEEHWPSRLLERSELKRLLAEAISKMPDVEKTVLSLYYHEELTLREISKILKLHESRISQLKSQAILRLRSYMEKRWPNPRGI